MNDLPWYILFSAFVLDMAMGDPAWLPHPVVGMGKAISFFEQKFRAWIPSPFFSGLGFALFLITATGTLSFGVIALFSAFHPLAGQLLEVLLLFFCFSSKSLYTAARAVWHPLKGKNLDAARNALAMIVGRQTQTLDESGVARAAVETVAENFVDGFVSPLFFALVFGVPGALTYKMINTLDSMVGYQNPAYILFGRAAARIDDAANFIPARISVVIIAGATCLFSRTRALQALKTALSQGRHHKSPNSGYPEAAFAGALNVCLGGPSIYHGQVVDKPYIGTDFPGPDQKKILMACDLMMISSLLATLGACALATFLGA
jgi:adenosylcobinamide-phosphate synthase